MLQLQLMTAVDTLTQTLRDSGYSATATRRTIFSALQHQEPLGMRELIARLPGIDRASVYRNIALFEQLGIVQRLQTGWKYKLELAGDFHEHHHHATCLNCGVLTIIPEIIELEQTVQKIGKIFNFRLMQHQLELQGYCERCSQKPE